MVEPSSAAGGTAVRRILLVEDEPSLVLTLTDRLLREGYQVETAGTGDEGLSRALEGSFDIILLDVMLPGGRDGFEVCRELRSRSVEVPIVMLTARGQVVDRVVGLKLGADDYVTKPFEMIELLARIEALFRRARTPSSSPAGTYAFGDVRVDFRRAEVFRGGERTPLSALEFKLLAYFIQNRGALLTRDELLDKVWGYDAMPTTRTVDVHVASLRQKLERNPSRPELILTVHRRGYRFAG
ncbi:MAG TPA: response regulator transcription factor [Thermoanaerobaculia bacterium]|jgi:two-component system alkaline phosphatase synthesis response regulator PhoP|nr:response regulator transcription factor [Thermoanaerobaculia bacterium]